MGLSLDDFKGSVASNKWGGFARSNLFKVEFGFPQGIGVNKNNTERFEYLCRAAQVPSYTQGNIEVPYRGRTLKIAGDRTYEPWTVTIMNDSKHMARNVFEKWARLIQEETHNWSKKDDTSLFGLAHCSLLKRNKKSAEDDYKTLRTYKLYDIWPSSVSAVDLDWGNNDAVQEFTVEFQVQYVTAGKDKNEAKTNSGDPGDAEGTPDELE